MQNILRSTANTRHNDDSVKAAIQQRPMNCFKNSARDYFPVWATRINTVHNDIAYDSRFSLIKGKSELLHQVPDKSKIFQNDKKKERKLQFIAEEINYHLKAKRALTAKLTSSDLNKGSLKSNKYKAVIANNIEQNETKNNQLKQNTDQLFYSSLIERETIVSNINKKSSHHLRFEKQPNRPININTILYNKDHEIEADPLHPKLISQRSSHSFKSYSPRKVFQPKQILDKYYDFQISDNDLKFHRSKSGIHFHKMILKNKIKLDPSQPPAFTRLHYEAGHGQKHIKPKLKTYDMEKYQKRNLNFPRQIICSKRGCSR